ncbi:VOC family protein [Mucilaginibacter auburnensis]|uniref:Glyoxalase/bleomycin resistance protein/dioxygenase superfamily protein n=1 Tax=Mucilaginibacter auburnensis TaxID=1457233 RepID=A0A2H9VQX9_9SPHI|nr:hypothetical protein [Mucilaginibacter auburnensis]PJJ83178.1 hypothetical protein CLV57_0156 [Mucilaginibacter auburnensis]
MNFTKLVPSLFYADINIALKTFIDCLGFTMGHQELEGPNPFCVVEQGQLKLMIFENMHHAHNNHPELRLETDNIDEVYQKVVSAFPGLLHPNLDKVTLRPWGAKEFAMLDGQIGIRVMQW